MQTRDMAAATTARHPGIPVVLTQLPPPHQDLGAAAAVLGCAG
jgi:hypothetical protein